ncbi:MAG: SET domain-containing protein-lysine N-methyltransferase [Pseudonocardiaceae bacterium]|nr:SET domain-containing protein-lysine N-methyltransferase [Pseudonocardiaceae bacterium]
MTDHGIDVLATALLGGAPCIETISGTEVARSPVHGRGLLARRAWAAEDVLGTLDGQIVDVTRYPGVIEALEWNALSAEQLLVRPIRTSYGFMNHSTRPNVSIDDDGRVLRACQDIAPGDELTIDYFAQPVPAAYLASAEAAVLRASTGQ